MPIPTVTVNTSGQPDVARNYKRYQRYHPTNGKGDAPRSCFSEQFRRNYDDIDWGLKPVQKHFLRNGTIDGHGKFREGLGEVRRAVKWSPFDPDKPVPGITRSAWNNFTKAGGANR